MSVASGVSIGGDWVSVEVDRGTAGNWSSRWCWSSVVGWDSWLSDVTVGSSGTTVSGDVLVSRDGLLLVVQSKGLTDWLWNTVV